MVAQRIDPLRPHVSPPSPPTDTARPPQSQLLDLLDLLEDRADAEAGERAAPEPRHAEEDHTGDDRPSTAGQHRAFDHDARGHPKKARRRDRASVEAPQRAASDRTMHSTTPESNDGMSLDELNDLYDLYPLGSYSNDNKLADYESRLPAWRVKHEADAPRPPTLPIREPEEESVSHGQAWFRYVSQHVMYSPISGLPTFMPSGLVQQLNLLTEYMAAVPTAEISDRNHRNHLERIFRDLVMRRNQMNIHINQSLVRLHDDGVNVHAVNNLVQRRSSSHFYIGMTSNPLIRMQEHMANRISGYPVYVMNIVRVFLTSARAASHEKNCITATRHLRGSLNRGDGGEGASPRPVSFVYVIFTKPYDCASSRRLQ